MFKDILYVANPLGLLLMAVLVLSLNIVNTSGEYIFGKYIVQTAERLYGTGEAGAAASVLMWS